MHEELSRLEADWLLRRGARRLDEAPSGRVMATAQARRAIEEATAPVLIVARGVPLRFGSLVATP